MTTAAARWLAGGLLLLTVAALAAAAGFDIAAHAWRDAFSFMPVLRRRDGSEPGRRQRRGA